MGNYDESMETGGETVGASVPPVTAGKMTLAKAIELGEYNPDYLATFPEWHELSPHIQFQYVRQALETRRRMLVVQWAETNNMMDFSTKPHLKIALDNIHKQLKKVEQDREKIYTEMADRG